MLSSLFRSRNDRLLNQYRTKVEKINALELKLLNKSDDELRSLAQALQERVQNNYSWDDTVIRAFALVREASRRVTGLRHYDVQLMGGLALVEGKISEMRTGEGKTLVATLAAYTVALKKQGVHVVTVNPYLAKRDAEYVRPIHEFLGMSVGVLDENASNDDKRKAYACDITYGTNSEFGFDYLRDNLVQHLEQKTQRGHAYAIVDEIDSILIDEARTPLIISGTSDVQPDWLKFAHDVARLLTRQSRPDGPGDFFIDEKQKSCTLAESGLLKIESILHQNQFTQEHMYQEVHLSLLGMIDNALKALHIYQANVDYVVRDHEIVIVDSFTGRLQDGRRWSDGLHQAIEVKESVDINGDNVTLCSVTYQNFFRMYQRLAGMTGTADTEAREFYEIYGLETVVIPTNKSMIRQDHPDKIYATVAEKYSAVVTDIRDKHQQGRPVLVGTTSVEQSELLSLLLQDANIPHEVLNAKNHAREADIIAQAGRKGSVTIATNMAGRGTDIIMGGNPHPDLNHMRADIQDLVQAERKAVLDLGGLHVIGTERHESRRVDNQLRGRAGRQGDPGSSQFYLSLEDHLLRIFGGERLQAFMQRMGMEEGEALESPMLSRSIESAQRRVENHHYEMRKQLLEYDDVINLQRTAFYTKRDAVLQGNVDLWMDMRKHVLEDLVMQYIAKDSIYEEWRWKELKHQLEIEWDLHLAWNDTDIENRDAQAMLLDVLNKADETFAQHIGSFSSEVQEQLVANTAIRSMDNWWQRHITLLDQLREGIHLQSYAQKDPKQVYKHEAFHLYKDMLDKLKMDVARTLQASRVAHTQEEGLENF